MGDGAEGGAKEITLQLDAGTATGSTELENVYYGTLPEGFAYQGQIMSRKRLSKTERLLTAMILSMRESLPARQRLRRTR